MELEVLGDEGPQSSDAAKSTRSRLNSTLRQRQTI
jgi:hypothetical protein